MFLRRLIDRRRARMRALPTPLRPGRRVYAVGDIHGRHDLLIDALARIDDHAAAHDGPSALIFMGDYVDRGDRSAEVLATLRARQDDGHGPVVALMGNHERMMLDFLSDPVSNARWLRAGGLRTLASYGVVGLSDNADATARRRAADALRAALPAGTEAWLADLPLIWRSGNLVCVHAGMDPALPPEAQLADTLIWGHRDFLSVPRVDGLWVAHGHVVVDEARARDGRVALDTGAYATDRLTVGVLGPEGATFL